MTKLWSIFVEYWKKWANESSFLKKIESLKTYLQTFPKFTIVVSFHFMICGSIYETLHIVNAIKLLKALIFIGLGVTGEKLSCKFSYFNSYPRLIRASFALKISYEISTVITEFSYCKSALMLLLIIKISSLCSGWSWSRGWSRRRSWEIFSSCYHPTQYITILKI